MRILPFLLLAVLLSFSSELVAQQKFERETRLRENDVPAAALSFIQATDPQERIRWYYEENLEGNSVEAKFKRESVRYSVEFDTLGNIQDVEIEISPEELEASLKQQIDEKLAEQFTKYKWQKLQRQFTGSVLQLQNLLREEAGLDGYTIHYELELKGTKSGDKALYEITFDEAGQITRQRQIIFKNANHLEY